MKKLVLLFHLLLGNLAMNAQVTQILEINDAGSSNSSPANFFVYNDKVYFSADDSNGSNTGGIDLGRELWVTDGTAAGTSLVKDLNIGDGNSSPGSFFEYNNTMYFSARDGITTGNILFSSDGTAGGTVTAGNTPVFNPVLLDGLVYFINTLEGNALYQFDGTTGAPVADTGTGNERIIRSFYIPFGSKLLCYMDYSTDTIGGELYEYDPATDSFTLIKDIAEGEASAGISNFTLLDGEVYFEALDSLWKTDGTGAATVQVAPAAAASIGGVNNLYAWQGSLFFEGDDGSGDQLWKYDPQSDAVTKLSNISGDNTNHDPGDYAPAGAYLYYSAKDANDTQRHLWKTGGTTVEQLDNTISNVDDITVYNDMLVFEGNNGTTGNELYRFPIPQTLATDIQITGEASMLINSTQTLSLSFFPTITTNQTATWSTSDPTIATVDENGLVAALSVGNVVITATANDGSGVADIFAIRVDPVLIASITIDGELEMNEGTTQSLTLSTAPGNATDSSVSWSSSNTTVATVDGNGMVTALQAGGVEITATANDGSTVFANISITVVQVVLSIDDLASRIEVWPNPAGEFINFTLPAHIQNVTLSIIDLAGKVMDEIELGNPHLLDVSWYEKGIYFLRFQGNDGLHTKRILLE